MDPQNNDKNKRKIIPIVLSSLQQNTKVTKQIACTQDQKQERQKPPKTSNEQCVLWPSCL